jgi:hypothetical protein
MNNSALIVFNYGLFGGLTIVWVLFLKLCLLVAGSFVEFSKVEPNSSYLILTFQAVRLFAIAPPHFTRIKSNCIQLICDNQALYAYGTYEKEL